MISTLLENVSALAEQMKGLARQANAEYAAEVDAVKPRKCVIIPHNTVLVNMTFHTLAMKYACKDTAART